MNTEFVKEQYERKKARESLLDFTLYTMPEYEVNWHHRVICDILDRFLAGEIKRLIIETAPRHGKSEIGSRRFPAYALGKYPDKSIISCSYSADLASRMNRDVQRIIDTPEYRNLFPDTTMSDSNNRAQNATGKYQRNNDLFEVVGHKGVYRSAGVGGGITGMGCNIGIIDDPIKNREEALSTTYREKTWEWYTTTFYTRLEKDASILLIMTRWHEDDLAGRILKQAEENGEQWEVVCLPAISEPESRSAYDIRTEPNIALWENKYNLDRLAEIRAVLGPYQFAALYQQRPTPITGGMWKYADIDKHRVSKAPQLTRVVVGVDPAVTSDVKSDETGIVVVGIGKDKDLYVLGDYSIRGTPLEWAHQVVYAYESHDADRVIGEVNNGGDMIESTLRFVMKSLPYTPVHASRGKQIRAEPIAAMYEQGQIHHVGSFPMLEGQMVEWVPGEKSPDRMDALVWACTELSGKKCSLAPMFASFSNSGM